MLSNAMNGEASLHHQAATCPGTDYKLAHLCLECRQAHTVLGRWITTAQLSMLNLESVDRDLEDAPRQSCPSQQKPDQAVGQARFAAAAHAKTRSVSAKAVNVLW